MKKDDETEQKYEKSQYLIRLKGNDFPIWADEIIGTMNDKTIVVRFTRRKTGEHMESIIATDQIAILEKTLSI